MAKLTSRQKQAIATKLKISDTAFTLFREYGYEKVKITDICQKANISVGNFYHYFESKEKIIENSYKQIELLLKSDIEVGEYESSFEKALAIFKSASSILDGELGWRFVAQSYRLIITSTSKYTISHERYAYSGLIETIQNGIDSGEFASDLTALEITEACMRTGRGVVFDWCVREGSYKLADLMVSDVSRVLSTFKA
ncbi:MAG: TetR/AcrR family transcriptional regulator [Oscillospiraceae bacterium]